MRKKWLMLLTIALFLRLPAVGQTDMTAQRVMDLVQQQLAAPSELVHGDMTTYLADQVNRRYHFVLARHWDPATGTEMVRIDFESPTPIADTDSAQRADNRYLLKRAGSAPPAQWLYLPALRRVRIAPYHPAERLLQSDYWFYDLTAIQDVNDYDYTFIEEHAQAPVIAGTPRVGFVPYERAVFALERRGETYVVTAITYHAAGGDRTVTFSAYQEIVRGRFRPGQVVVRATGSRTEIAFREWTLDAAAELFTATALETKPLTLSAERKQNE
jgi:Outer membrane lipoprotein-sorting protein